MDAMTVLRSTPGVRRAWPGKDRGLTVELLEPHGPGEPRLRAGRIDASGHLQLLPHAQDPDLPGLSPRLEGRLVVHRAGRRAVVLGPEQATKLVRPGRVVDPGAAGLPFARVGLRTAEVLEVGSCHLALAVLPGRTLHELGDRGLPGWERLAQVWPSLAAQPTDLPVHGPLQEANVLERWLGHVRDHGALDGVGALDAQVERTCALLVQDGGTLVASHRDLHDKQLLWDGEDLGVLDLDTAASAEAALDLGNLVAHADLMELTGRLSGNAHRQVLDLLDDVAVWMPTTTARLLAYTRAARLRLACVHAFRPGAEAWLPTWLDRCLRPSTTTEWNVL